MKTVYKLFKFFKSKDNGNVLMIIIMYNYHYLNRYKQFPQHFCNSLSHIHHMLCSTLIHINSKRLGLGYIATT